MRYRDLCLRALAALAVAVAPTLVRAQGAAPLRIGFICPASGGSADFGTSARLGAELAVQEINEAGGFLGRPVQLVARDDQANPDRGRAVAEELVLKEKVEFTIGFCNTGVAMKSLDVFQDNKHLLLVPVSTGSAVTAKYPAAESFVFRLSPRDRVQAAFIVNDIVERRKLTKVAVFADRTGYGEGGFKDVVGFLAERGLQPVYTARFDLGVQSLAAEVQAAKAAGAQALVGYSVGPELAVLAQARRDAKYDGLMYGPWPMSFRTVWDKSGGGAEGALMVQSIIPNLANERRSSFIARLKRHAGSQSVASLMAAAQTYDAVHLMLRALFQTRGDGSAASLKHALENLDKPYVGVVTTYERPFSKADHDAFTMNMVWLGTWRSGEIRFQYPEDEKRASFIRRKQ
ncbi:ABC transporter substrate-binding protein [Aquincola sp. S2]|uniref:ABC transporter substrate-binding protein n=1 Tax=Pseudaquabacterium terrae TaxID=2732868 RepID=A0ABX2EHH0_9BURK|nr:ABC transporter substrate-binding protein [Aquabacterium terrae]NRF68053.1 ABC transporter substrate-binding protein [Aquabacterium terrae]